jgi:TrmH family RNA methyltransferase
MIKQIQSSQNEIYKKLVSLTSASGIKKHQLFILSGEKLVREFLEKPRFEIVYEVLGPGMKPLQRKHHTLELAGELFKEIDVLGTHFNLLICQTPVFEVASLGEGAQSGLEVIAPLQDPQNLGAVIRSCAAFGVQRLHLTKESCHPFLPKSIKASANGILYVDFVKLSDFDKIEGLDQSPMYVLDIQGETLEKALGKNASQKKAFLLLGQEGSGFSNLEWSQKLLQHKNCRKVSIPMNHVESLNVSVAASLFIYSFTTK